MYAEFNKAICACTISIFGNPLLRFKPAYNPREGTPGTARALRLDY